VVLGDNIIEYNIRAGGGEFFAQGKGAKILLKEVHDPQRFGVAEIDGDRIAGIVEKPAEPKSNLAVIGIYMFDRQVFDIVRTLKPSNRGELEITDVNNAYIERANDFRRARRLVDRRGHVRVALSRRPLVAEGGANKLDAPAVVQAGRTGIAVRSGRGKTITDMHTILVTGAAGFIGNFVRLLLRERPRWHVIAYDALTYAGNLENLADCRDHDAAPSSAATSATPLRWRRCLTAASTRWSTSRPSRTSIAAFTARRIRAHQRHGYAGAARPGPRARGQTVRAGFHRRGLRLARADRQVYRDMPLAPTARTARRRRQPICSCSPPTTPSGCRW
jgi:hypothetical protein